MLRSGMILVAGEGGPDVDPVVGSGDAISGVDAAAAAVDAVLNDSSRVRLVYRCFRQYTAKTRS